jgi:hypothetical protein
VYAFPKPSIEAKKVNIDEYEANKGNFEWKNEM